MEQTVYILTYSLHSQYQRGPPALTRIIFEFAVKSPVRIANLTCFVRVFLKVECSTISHGIFLSNKLKYSSYLDGLTSIVA